MRNLQTASSAQLHCCSSSSFYFLGVLRRHLSDDERYCISKSKQILTKQYLWGGKNTTNLLSVALVLKIHHQKGQIPFLHISHAWTCIAWWNLRPKTGNYTKCLMKHKSQTHVMKICKQLLVEPLYISVSRPMNKSSKLYNIYIRNFLNYYRYFPHNFLTPYYTSRYMILFVYSRCCPKLQLPYKVITLPPSAPVPSIFV